MSNIKKGSKLTVSTANGISRASSNNLGVLEVSGPGLANVVSQDSTFSLSSSNVPQFTIGATDNSGIFQLGLDNQGNAVLESTLNGSNKNILIQQLGGYVGIGTTNPASTLHVKSTDAIIIPVGTNDNRPGESGQITAQNGMIRYNTTTSQFEGYGPGSTWGSLGGVKDVDGDTYILSETSPGTDNDDLQFFTAGSQKMVILDSGYVGIGTTNPGEKLHIKGGNIKIEQSSTMYGKLTYNALDAYGDKLFLQWNSGTDIIACANGGNVGIGTNNATGGKLHVVGDIFTTGKILGEVGGSKLIVGGSTYQSATAPTNGMLVEGYVGIGTTSPDEKLDIAGVTITKGLQLISSDVNNNNITRPAIATRSTTVGIKDYEIAAIPHYYTNKTTNYGANNGFLRIRAGGGSAANTTSYIDLTGYAASGYADMDKNIVFGTSGTERMRILNNGNVGIGTTDPNYKLAIEGHVGIKSGSYLIFGNSQGGVIEGNTSMLHFKTAGTRRMSISNGGNVGIGYTDPGTYKLKVNGSLFCNDAFYSGTLHYYRGDTNTRRYWDADQMWWTCAGGTSSYEMWLKNGKVGIGMTTTAPLVTDATYQLHLNGSSGGGLVCYRNNSDTGTLRMAVNSSQVFFGAFGSSTHRVSFMANGGEKMTIKADGNVGIGSTDPGYKLQVYGTFNATDSSTFNGSIYGLSNVYISDHITHLNDTDTKFGFNADDQFEVRVGGNQKIATIGGNIQFGGASNSGWPVTLPSGGTYSYAKINTASMTCRGQLDVAGNVGIGTTGPTSKLWIEDSATETRLTIRNKHASDSNSSIIFHTTNNNNAVIWNDDNTKFVVRASNGVPLHLGANADNNHMVINTSGNVGIGTTSPNAKLEIKGDSNDYGGIVLSQNSNWSSRPALWNPGTDTSTHDYEIVGRSAGNASYGFLRLMAGGGNAHNSRIELAAYTGNNNGKNIAFFTNNTQQMILDVNGNVGIGTTSPTTKLHVYGNQSVYFQGQRPCIFYRKGVTGDGTLKWVAGMNEDPAENYSITGYNSAGHILLNPTGNVGIGTTSPQALLQLEPDTGYTNPRTTTNYGSAIHMIPKSNTDHTAITFSFSATDKNIMSAICANTSYGLEHIVNRGRHHFFYGSSSEVTLPATTTNDLIMIMRGDNKRVGIGTSSPSTTLHIYTIDGTANTGSRHQINANGGVSASGTVGNMSLRVRGRSWFEDYTFHTSDSRIKKEIEDVPDNLALQQVRNIPCKYYKYVDTYEKGDSRTIGFIAQEVNDVLPMAISIKTGIIPSVYKVISCEWTGNVMYSQELGTVSGVKYKFYVSNTNNDEVEKIVTGSSDNTFTFDTSYNNVFCYGKEVDDFHTVDKNKLFALNFSATQEIDRLQQQEITKVQTLQTDLSTANTTIQSHETTIQQQATKITTLETQIADILSRLSVLENSN